MPFEQTISSILQRRPIVLQLLRFAAIGALNTALDFIILNFITKTFDIQSGIALGVLNVLSFGAAVIQSYFWNKAWAFAQSANMTVFQNFFRLVMVGGLGFAAFLAVFVGAGYDASNLFYLLVLVGFIVIEFILWMAFGLRLNSQGSGGSQFVSFIIVSVIGLIINSAVVVVAVKFSDIGVFAEMINRLNLNADLVKNLAKVAATALSLIWNFIGYKLIVFKR